MRRGTIFTILLIVLGVAAFAGLQVLQRQPALEFTVAVHPLAEDWVRSAADAFNATNPVVGTSRIQMSVVAIDDLSVWGTTARTWSPQNHPVMWIPGTSTSIAYANESGLPFETVEPSLARTVLVWGAFASRYNALTNDSAAPLDWPRVAEAAAQIRWADIAPDSGLNGNINLAFNNPERTLAGLASVLSANARFTTETVLTQGQTNLIEFRNWLTPVLESVPNFNSLGASPAETLAARGASVGDVALLPESEWLVNLRGSLAGSDPVVLSYPEYNFLFDFPLASWIAADAAPQTSGAVAQFGDWLLSAPQQAAAQRVGLRPATGTPTDSQFTSAQAFGVQLNPDLSRLILMPPRNVTQGVLSWVGTLVQ